MRHSIQITTFDHGSVNTLTYAEVFSTPEEACEFLEKEFGAIRVTFNTRECFYHVKHLQTDYFTIYNIVPLYEHGAAPRIVVVDNKDK